MYRSWHQSLAFSAVVLTVVPVLELPLSAFPSVSASNQLVVKLSRWVARRRLPSECDVCTRAQVSALVAALLS